MTQGCTNQWSFDMFARPASSSMAQSSATPLRSVWPRDSVEVRYDACVRAKPKRRTACVPELGH
eukprot:5179286-Pyramimonas_sp.AAC.1